MDGCEERQREGWRRGSQGATRRIRLDRRAKSKDKIRAIDATSAEKQTESARGISGKKRCGERPTAKMSRIN
jgi:hypothetical protein